MNTTKRKDTHHGKVQVKEEEITCSNCKLRPAIVGRKNCSQCASVKQHHVTMLRQKLCKKGICRDCLKRKVMPGFLSCSKCAAARIQRYKDYKSTARCLCGTPLDELAILTNRTRCSMCAEKHRLANIKWRAKKRRS